MRHRAQWYHTERIQALNSIEVVFFDEKNVLAKWKAFNEHTRSPKPDATVDPAGVAAWNENLDTTLCDLYQAIGNSLNYNFDLKRIKQGAYIPQLQADFDEAQVGVWFGLAKALKDGELTVRMKGEGLGQGASGVGAG